MQKIEYYLQKDDAICKKVYLICKRVNLSVDTVLIILNIALILCWNLYSCFFYLPMSSHARQRNAKSSPFRGRKDRLLFSFSRKNVREKELALAKRGGTKKDRPRGHQTKSEPRAPRCLRLDNGKTFATNMLLIKTSNSHSTNRSR